jgi:hypothetical protein
VTDGPTPADFRSYRRAVLRMVEAQHRISTSRLADGPIEEERLEALVEAVKPPLPRSARGLHYLLATPFRYGHRTASRFRRANERPGIFYASEHSRTCLAEMAYWRLRFFAAAPAAQLPVTTTDYLMFRVRLGCGRAFDLTKPPFDRDQARWVDPADWSACQAFARQARSLDTQLIRYPSARDADGGVNVALLDPAAFRDPVPLTEGSWHFRFQSGRLLAIAAAPGEGRFEYGFEQFGLTRG